MSLDASSSQPTNNADDTSKSFWQSAAAFDQAFAQTMPAGQWVLPNEVPEPYRRLLVHDRDMTPTMAGHYQEALCLKRLQQTVAADRSALTRQVLLMTTVSQCPALFGTIQMNLNGLPSSVSQSLIEGDRPLGQILHDHAIDHTSEPVAFFSLTADQRLMDLLSFKQSVTLWGRHNRLYLQPKGATVERSLLAEVIEILRPVECGDQSSDEQRSL